MGISLGDALLKLGIDKTDLDKGLKEVEANVKSAMEKVQTQLRMTGAAFLAVGIAGLKMSSDARNLNAQLGQTAITIGSTTSAMRALALDTTDVTFGLQSVAATFDLLARAGVSNTLEMQKSAKAFDALADATGSNAETVAELLLPAFKLFGEEIPITANELDKFTWLTKRTLVDLSDFGTLLTRMAPYMDTLNMSMDDAIAILAALSEKGITGTAATLKLRTAITQAANEGKTLNETLGLTQAEIDGFRLEMEGATGITEQYANEANKQYGIMDKLKQTWGEMALRLSTFLEPLEPIMAAMTALGPLLLFASTGMGRAAITTALHTVALIAHTIATKAATVAKALFSGALITHISITGLATAANVAFTASIHALNVAIKALMGPIGWILLALGAVAAVFTGLIFKSKAADKATQQVADNISSSFQQIQSQAATALDSVSAEYDLLIQQAKLAGDVAEEMRLTFESVSKRIDIQSQVVANLNMRYEEMVELKGKNSDEAQELKLYLDRETNSLSRLRAEMLSTIETYREVAQQREDVLKAYQELLDKYYGEEGLFTEAEKKYNEAIAQRTRTHNEQMAREAVELTETYEREYESRKSSLYDWLGLFEHIPQWAYTSGQELLRNLQQQVRWFDTWQDEISKLAERGVQEGLLKELQEMGPEALPQIIALRQMTDEQLTKYQELWAERNKQVTEQTTSELGQLVIDANTQLAGLVGLAEGADSPVQQFVDAYNEQLGELVADNAEALASLRLDYDNELIKIGKQLQDELDTWIDQATQAGIEIPEGLIGGLEGNIGQWQSILDNYGDIWRDWVDDRLAELAEWETAIGAITPPTMPTVEPITLPYVVDWTWAKALEQIKNLSPAPSTTGESWGQRQLQAGAVVKKPTAAIIGESPLAVPEIVSPISLMAETFEKVLAKFPMGGVSTITNHYYISNEFPGLTIREEADITKLSRSLAREIKSELAARGV